MKPTKSETIAFRVNADIAKKIDNARKAYGLSRGEWIRGFVITSLYESDERRHLTEVSSNKASFDEVAAANELTHQALKRLTFVLLTHIGKLAPEEAKKLSRRLLDDSPATARKESIS